MPSVTYGATAVWDAVAVLALFDAVNQVGRIDGSTKAQKLVFLAEVEGKRQARTTAHFRFLRHRFGPYGPVLAHKITDLERTGILTVRRALSPRARYILDYAQPYLDSSPDARAALEIFQGVAERYGRMTGGELKELVYEMPVPVVELNDEVRLVKDIPSGFDIIDPTREPTLASIQPFDHDALEEITAELRMDPEVLNPGSAAYKKTVSDALKRMSQS